MGALRFLGLYFSFLLPLTADGSARDSGQWRVLICATGSHQQCHSASRRPITEGKNLQDHSSLTDFEMSSDFSSFYLLGICSLLRVRKHKAERALKVVNISLGVFGTHTHTHTHSLSLSFSLTG